MGSIREISYETDTARFHISVFRDINRRGVSVDYFGYAPKTIPKLSSGGTAAIPGNIVSEHRHGAHLEKLVDGCKADIERRFGKIVTSKVIDRVPHPEQPGHIQSIIHSSDADSAKTPK